MARKLERHSLFVGGQWAPPLSGRYLPSYDPTSGEPWYELPDADSDDVLERLIARAERVRIGPRAIRRPSSGGSR